MLSAVTPHALVPQRHSIRRIRPMVDQARWLVRGLSLRSHRLEREAALEMQESASGKKRVAAGAGRGCDTRGFVRNVAS